MKIYFKILLVMLFLIGMYNVSFAQPITGTKTVTHLGGGDYISIASAIADLNSKGVGTGGVIFDVAPGHIETFAAATSGTITATGTALNPIVFRKASTGTNPLITASGLGTIAPSTGTASHGDGIIIIVGGDFITFDGIDLQEMPAATGNARSEYGYYLKKASPTDACKNVTIRNSTITLDKTVIYSFGIFVSNIYAASSVTVTSTGGRSEYIKIYSNNVSNCYGGILAQGFGSLSQDIWDQNIEIGVDGANTITNFGGGSSTVYGILTNYQHNLKVANNVVNGGSGSTASQMYGIRTDNGSNSNLDLYGNTVSLQTGSATTAIVGIYNAMGGGGTSNTVNIYNNIVENCSYSVAATTGTFNGIQQAAAAFTLNVYNNTVRNNTKAGTGLLNGINNSSVGTNGTLNLYNNSVYGNSNTGAAALSCITIAPSATATTNIYGNNIYNNSSAGNTLTGLLISNGASNNIYRNNIYNLSSSVAASLVYGINSSGGTNSYFYNNFISDLKAPAASNGTAIAGMYFSAGTTNAYAYNNTVYLNASSTATTFGSAAIYVVPSATLIVELKNNIFVNNSTPGSGATGNAVAYKRSLTTFLTSYSGNSNYNCLYAGTPSAKNLLFSDGTNNKQTIADYFAYVTPRDGASFSELPPFVNTAAAPYDLHLQTTVNTQCESGGSVISTPNITQDFDLDARYPNPGYPNKLGYPASAPDVGADEFGGQQSDLTPPSISYSAITNKPAGTSLALNNFAVISDPSGVNTTAGTAPRIYYKKSTDNNSITAGNNPGDPGWKYTETTSGSSPFSFTINYSLLKDGSVSNNDVIQYFVVAQDNSPSPKVGINAGSFNVTPASVNLVTANLPVSLTPINQYTISGSFSGTINVGTGQTYTTLTAAGGLFAAINAGVVSGNITVNIVSDITTETGANALNQFTEYPNNSNYTITIQPNAAINRTLSGTTATALGLIKLNGADRVTFDGRFGGSGNYLTIQNLSTATNTAAIHIASLGIGLGANNNTIRNCNIKAGTNTVTSAIGIYAGGAAVSTSGTGANNNNLTIQNNNVSKCYYGILTLGVTITGELSNLNISNNTIGSNTASDYVLGYGINVASANSPVISGNEIFNMIYDGNKYGMQFGTTVYNATISKNKIHGLSGSISASKSCVGIYFNSGTLVSNNTVDNNIIYDMSNFSTAGSNYGPYGIWLAGGTTFNIYYNSISLTGALGGSTVASITSCLWISSQTTNINLRNNIFYNTITGNNPRTYLIGAASNTTFANINYNDYYTTGDFFGNFGGVAIQTFDDWKTTIGQDANSKNVDPNYQSATDLRPGTASGVLNSAVPIGGFETDILGVTRNVSTPTIGAYEQGVDASGPSITYNLLAGTSSTSNRTISNVTITDPIGVSSSPKPRLYFKRSGDANTYIDNTNGTDGWKYTESNGTASPFDFTFNYSLLNGGTGVTTGTTVQYFITAQDLSLTPYVSINSGSFAATPSSVALTSAAFPIGGTINSYQVNNALSGIVSVGTGGTYPTLTGAGGLFADVNSRSIGGNITVNIKSDLTEDCTNSLNEFFTDGAKTSYTITIQPEDAVMKVISTVTASNAGLINLNGCNGVTIDGSFGGSGKYLTFRNTEYLNFTNSSVIAIRNGATNNTVKNCMLEGAVGVNTCGVVFFDYGANTGNKITNCDIKNVSSLPAAAKPFNGIYFGNILNKNNIISSCNIYDFSTNGIFVNESGGVYIDSCNIYLTSPSAAGPTGIALASAGETKIVKNLIHDLDSQVGSNGRSKGISYNGGSSPYPANISIENNSISLALTATNNFVLGIDINSTSANSNYVSIYYNSIYIGGSINNANASYSACLNIANAVMSGLIHKNNAYHNDRIVTGGGTGKNYAVFTTTAATFVSDYNDYYVSGSPGVLASWYGLEINTISDWQSATGKDANSVSGDPKFLSNTDLKISTSHPFSPVLNAGTTISGITTDFFGNSRSETTPDMGIYEMPAPGAFSLVAPPFDTTGMATTVNFSWTASTNVGIYTFQFSKSNLFDTLIKNDTVFSGTTKSVAGLAKSTTYHWRVKSINGAGATSWLTSKFTTASTPLPVTLISPNNATKIRVAGSDFKWITPQIPNLAGFVYQVTKDTTGAPVVSDTINLVKNGLDSIYTYNKGGFEYFTNYYWRVVAKNDFGYGDYSLYFKFQTELGPPPVSPIFPPNDTTGIFPTLTLNWPDAPGAVSYRVQLSSDSLFGSTILNVAGLPVSQVPVPDGYLMPMSKYYWRVNSTNADTTTGWTPTFRFNTLGQPMSVILATPANLDTNVGAVNTVFKWFKAGEFTDNITDIKSGVKSGIETDESEAISKYWFELVTDTTTLANLVRDSLLTDTVKTIASLNPLTNYYFRVRAKNEINWGTFSGWNKFKTTLALPTLLTPANNATELALTQIFDWTDAPTATSYDFQLATDAGFTALVYNITGQPLSTFTTPVPLTQFTQYYWRVRSTGPIGTTPYYTTPFAFKTRPDAPVAPTLLSPANNSTGLTLPVTLTWSKISNAYSYRLQVATDLAFTNLVFNDSTLTINDTSKVIDGLQTLTTYYWRVNVTNSAGTSPYAGPWNFRGLGIPNTITLVSPANGAINQPIDIKFVWRKAVEPLLALGNKSIGNKLETDDPDAISKYYFELTQDTVTFAGIFRDSTVADTTLFVDSLQNNRTYFWRVKAKNEVGNGNFSVWFRFKTIITNPVFPVLVTPANNAINQRIDTLVFHWRKVDDNVLASLLGGNNVKTETDEKTSRGNDKSVTNDRSSKEVIQTDEITAISMYIFQLALSGTDTSTIIFQDTNLAGPSDTTLTMVGLANNTNYYWRVKAKNQIGEGPFAPWFKFTTIVAAPIAPVLTTPANNATGITTVPAFVWGAVTGASSYRIQVSASNTFGTTLLDSAGITGTTVTMPAGLLTGATTYYWRVSAANVGGTSPYSSIFNFGTLQNLSLNLKVYLEGFYSGPQLPDTVRVYLANSTAPFAFVDTAKVVLSSTGTASISFARALAGSYYIVINHRNHLETWSKLPQLFVTNGTVTYDFTTAATQAYGDNMKLVGSVWVLYGGDANRDGSVDAMDVPIFIAQYGTQGYLAADFNGDGDVDALDVAIFVPNFGLTKAAPIATVSPILKTKEHDLTRILDSKKKTKETVNTQDKNVKKNEVKKNEVKNNNN